MNEDDISLLTSKYKADLQRAQYKIQPLICTLENHLVQLRSEPAAYLHMDATNLLHTLDWALKNSYMLQPALLNAYISELIKIMENLGAGPDFTIHIDQAISFYHEIGYPVFDLLLAKSRYLRLTEMDSLARKKALEAALKIVQEPKEVSEALINLAIYYNDTSQYHQAIKICQQVLGLFEKENPTENKATALTLIGLNYFNLFEYDASKHYFELGYQEALNFSDADNIATALHYLGRIEVNNGDLRKALTFFLEGQKYQDTLDVGAHAFIELRIGELLIASGRLDQALDHLTLSRDTFGKMRFNSSGVIQAELAIADLYVAQKKYDKAETTIQKALEYTQNSKFFRGELLCFVKLFWVYFRQFHMFKASGTLIQAGLTWRGGELQRNDGLKLLIKYLYQVLSTPLKILRRVPHTITGGSSFNVQKVESCTCDIHFTPSGDEKPLFK